MRLYLDDLDDLLRLLRDRTEGVSFKAGNADVDEASDLRDATSRELQAVYIDTWSPSVYVQLTSYGASVFSYEDSSAAADLVRDAGRLLDERRMGRFARHLLSLWGIGTIATVLLVPLVPAWLQVLALASFLLQCGLAALVVAGKMVPLSNSAVVIVPARRGDHRSIREGRLLWLVGTVIAIGVSVLMTYWQVSASD